MEITNRALFFVVVGFFYFFISFQKPILPTRHCLQPELQICENTRQRLDLGLLLSQFYKTHRSGLDPIGFFYAFMIFLCDPCQQRPVAFCSQVWISLDYPWYNKGKNATWSKENILMLNITDVPRHPMNKDQYHLDDLSPYADGKVLLNGFWERDSIKYYSIWNELMFASIK